MCSPTKYIITKNDVYEEAGFWLGQSLKLEYQSRKCSDSLLVQILLIAASRVISVFAACRDLARAPSYQTLANAMNVCLPEMQELEKRINQGLCTKLPKALFRKQRPIAVDLTLIPYHGLPLHDEKEVYRSQAKSGTTHFHAYATAAIVHQGFRYTVALVYVEKGVKLKDILQRLLQLVRKQAIGIKYVLLDKAFYNVAVISYLKSARYGFIIPAVVRGRAPKDPRKTKGLRAIRKKHNGYYDHTMTSGNGQKAKRIGVTICVASKRYQDKKTKKTKYKKLLYAIWKIRLTPQQIRELYRKRFGIETSYRQMNEARIKTCTRDPRQRLLFIAVALILRNVWVWLHFQWARGKYDSEPEVFLELLRFREMLSWIQQVIEQMLGAAEIGGLEIKKYQRVRGYV